MRREIQLVFVFLLALVTAGSVAAQTLSADEVVIGIYEALNAGDLDGAMALVADDAVLTLIPPPEGLDGVFIGKEAIRDWYEGLVADHGHADFSDVVTSDTRTSVTLIWSSDLFEDMGVSPITFDGTAIVQEGQVKALVWVFTLDTVAKFEALE